MDLDADEIEQAGMIAACAVARSTITDLRERKASLLAPEQLFPICEQTYTIHLKPRAIDFWGGAASDAEPQCSCPTCRREFLDFREKSKK